MIDHDETFDYLEAMRLYADGVEIERKTTRTAGQSDVWKSVIPVQAGFLNMDEVCFYTSGIYRRKPKTMTLVGVEFPEPIREEPDDGDICHWVRGSTVDVVCYSRSIKSLRRAWQMGLLQATYDGAKQQRRAMILSVGGEP